METSETELMLRGYGLTTAELYYRMPDFTHVLNTFIWQDYDLAPDHPKLFEFIEIWQVCGDLFHERLSTVRRSHLKLFAREDPRTGRGR